MQAGIFESKRNDNVYHICKEREMCLDYLPMKKMPLNAFCFI